MVAQDEGSSSSGEEDSQQRKSLMVAAIRQGKVKISEPILWVEGVPSNQQPVSAVVEPERPDATTAEEAGEEGQIHGLAISTDDPSTVNAVAVDDNFGDVPLLNHKQSLSNGGGETVESQDIFVPPDTADQKSEHKRSIFMDDEMASPSPTSPEKKKVRRSGTFRTVLRRVFGRKEKRQSKNLSPPQSRRGESRSGVKHEYTRSDPLPSTRPKASPTQQQVRGVSSQNAIEPLHEVGLDSYGTSTPVQQTLPFPMNVNAPQPESPVQDRRRANYLSFETSPRVHRRRATLPSMIISPEEGTTLHKMWSTTDLTPIGSASDQSGMASFGLPSPSIGVAISSSGAHPNRRSRSAGALHELAKYQAQTTQPSRRRSSEIKYWRASKIDSQQDVLPASSRDPSPDRSARASSITQTQTEVSEALADTGSSIHEGHLDPLDFSSVTSDRTTAERDENVLEQRLLQLESNMHRLSISFQEHATRSDPPREREFALKPAPRTNTPQVVFVAPTPSRQASSGIVTDSAPPQRMPSMRYQQPRAVPSPSPSKGSYQHSYLSSTSTAAAPASPQATYLQPHTPYPPAPSSVQSAPQVSATAGSQHVSQATLEEHIRPLYNALRYERHIRKALETQVTQLRSDVTELSVIVAQMRKQAVYGPQPQPKTKGGSPRGSPVKRYRINANGERSRFSGYDSSDNDTNVDAPLRSPQEQWTTPKEEHSMQWGSVVEGDMF